MEVSEFGRELTPVETVLSLYYESQDELEVAMNGRRMLNPLFRDEYVASIPTDEIEEMKKTFQFRRDKIVELFLRALDTHDGKTIIKIAEACWYLKDKRVRDRVPADRERAALLQLKRLLELAGIKLSVRAVAEILAAEAKLKGFKLSPSADGFSALRRKCKAMNFPLSESRKGKKK